MNRSVVGENRWTRRKSQKHMLFLDIWISHCFWEAGSLTCASMCSCCPMCRWWYTCTGKLLEPISQHVVNTLIPDRFRNVDGTYACTAFHVLAGWILLCINSIRHGHICIHLASTWKQCMHMCHQQFQIFESWTGKLEFGIQVVGAGPAMLAQQHFRAVTSWHQFCACHPAGVGSADFPLPGILWTRQT